MTWPNIYHDNVSSVNNSHTVEHQDKDTAFFLHGQIYTMTMCHTVKEITWPKHTGENKVINRHFDRF